MSGEQKVTPAQLMDASRLVASGSGKIDGELISMKRTVDALNWEGAGSASFQAHYANWQRAATQLQEALMGISEGLRNSSDAYQANEDAVKRAWGN